MTTSPTARRAPRAPWIIVAKREILTQVQSVAFWVGTLSTLALVMLSFAAATLFASGGSTDRIAVDSEQGAAVVALAKASGSDVEAVTVAPEQLESSVRSGEAEAALSYTEGSGWVLSVDSLADAPDLSSAVRDFQLTHNAMQAGVDPQQILANTTVSTVALQGDPATAVGIVIATMAFSILFMLSAITYGMQIAQSVVTEKESRIVEILAAAVPIRSLLVGKVVGNTLMALSQVVLLVCASLIGLTFTPYSDMISLIAPVAGWFIVFFLVGFAALACLWAAAGAMATRVQDLSQTTTPLTMIVMMVYLAGILVKGPAAVVLSYVPIASTVMMPGRLLNGEATWVDAVLALAVSAAFMVVTLWAGIKIYRRGLLQTNAVLSFMQLFRKSS